MTPNRSTTIVDAAVGLFMLPQLRRMKVNKIKRLLYKLSLKQLKLLYKLLILPLMKLYKTVDIQAAQAFQSPLAVADMFCPDRDFLRAGRARHEHDGHGGGGRVHQQREEHRRQDLEDLQHCQTEVRQLFSKMRFPQKYCSTHNWKIIMWSFCVLIQIRKIVDDSFRY